MSSLFSIESERLRLRPVAWCCDPRPGIAASIAVAECLGMEPKRSDELLGEPVIVYAINRAGAT